MKPSDRDRLLAEILADENVERLRTASLAGMLAAARRRRRRRTLVSGAAMMLVVVMMALAFSRRAPREITGPSPTAVSPPAGAASAAASTPGRVRIIDDQQLLALFPDRSVALIGAPGSQRLMFLDRAELKP